jgi:hypothetical protein
VINSGLLTIPFCRAPPTPPARFALGGAACYSTPAHALDSGVRGKPRTSRDQANIVSVGWPGERAPGMPPKQPSTASHHQGRTIRKQRELIIEPLSPRLVSILHGDVVGELALLRGAPAVPAAMLHHEVWPKAPGQDAVIIHDPDCPPPL